MMLCFWRGTATTLIGLFLSSHPSTLFNCLSSPPSPCKFTIVAITLETKPSNLNIDAENQNLWEKGTTDDQLPHTQTSLCLRCSECKRKGSKFKKRRESLFSFIHQGDGNGGGGRGMGGGGWFTSPLCRRRSNILLLAAAPSSNQGKTYKINIFTFVYS